MTDKPESERQVSASSAGHRLRIAVGALASLLCLTVYLLRLNPAAGLVSDDAWYIVLGMALAEGKGFTLISSPIPGLLPSYPPGFPLLLSLVFRLVPQFPDNVWLLKAVSLAAMGGVGVGTYQYLRKYRHLPSQLALGAACAVVMMPPFVFLATSTVMAECVFTLGQLLTVLLIERCAQRRKLSGDWVCALSAAALVSFTFLTRSVAAGLIVAVVLYLLKERLWRSAAIFLFGVTLCLAPWMLYARTHQPTREQVQRHGGNIIYSYGDQLWMKRAGDANSGRISWQQLPARVFENASDIVVRGTGGLFLPVLFRSAEESGEEVFALGYNSGMEGGSMGMATGTMCLSFCLSMLLLGGYVLAVRRRITLAELFLPLSLLITVIWPWWPFRYLLPLMPFLFFYLLTGIAGIHQFIQRRRTENSSPLTALRIVLVCVVVFYGYDHAQYLLLMHQSGAESRPEWLRNFSETEATLRWMREHLPPDAIVASSSPAMVYLYTGFRTVSADDPTGNRENWQKLGVRYAAILKPYAITPFDSEVHQVIHQTPRLRLRVVDLNRSDLAAADEVRALQPQ